MANEIRIDDLGAPVLNDVQKMAIEYGESTHTDLGIDAVCAAASARTGLDDFGPADFRERLGLQLTEMDADEERTGLGRMLMFGDCTRYAANRLLIRDLLQRHPEITDIPITRPVIVVGLPRSGTTHLVNLLAADSRFRSMPLWESYEPVPNPKEPDRGRRRRSPLDSLRRHLAGDAGGRSLRGSHAPDGTRPRARGD